MILIQSVNVPSGGTSSITFTSIPQTYRDLILYFGSRTSTNANWALMSINGGADTAIDLRHIISDGNTVATQSYSSGRLPNNQSSYTSGSFSYGRIYLPNYTNTSRNKSMAVMGAQTNNSTGRPSTFVTGLKWADNSAVTSISFTVDGGGNFSEFSTAYLYGIN